MGDGNNSCNNNNNGNNNKRSSRVNNSGNDNSSNSGRVKISGDDNSNRNHSCSSNSCCLNLCVSCPSGDWLRATQFWPGVACGLPGRGGKEGECWLHRKRRNLRRIPLWLLPLCSSSRSAGDEVARAQW